MSLNLGVPLLIRDMSANEILLPSSGNEQDRLFKRAILLLRETMDAIYHKVCFKYHKSHYLKLIHLLALISSLRHFT